MSWGYTSRPHCLRSDVCIALGRTSKSYLIFPFKKRSLKISHLFTGFRYFIFDSQSSKMDRIEHRRHKVEICSIAGQVLRRLEVLVENQQVPSEDSDLAFLTRLLQLAVGCRSMLRYRKCAPCMVPLTLHCQISASLGVCFIPKRDMLCYCKCAPCMIARNLHLNQQALVSALSGSGAFLLFSRPFILRGALR